MKRPSGNNADEWHLFLKEWLHIENGRIDGEPFVAVQIAEAIDDTVRKSHEDCARIADVTEQRLGLLYDTIRDLRERLRLKLEPGSDDLREEYKLANEALYNLGGRINSAGAIRSLADKEPQT